MRMTFMVNTSPFAGQEGKYVTSRNLAVRWHSSLKAAWASLASTGLAAGHSPRVPCSLPVNQERLDRELERNLALRVERGESADQFIVNPRTLGTPPPPAREVLPAGFDSFRSGPACR